MSNIAQDKGGILYELIDLHNGKGYAGKDSNPRLVDGVWRARRPDAHFASAKRGKGGCRLLNRAIRRNYRLYGKPYFLVIHHPDWHPSNVLSDAEKRLIKVREYYTDRSKGYNLTEGGEGSLGYSHSKEAIEKMNRKWNAVKYQAIAMRKAGATYKEIAVEVGMDSSNIRSHLLDEGFQKCGENKTYPLELKELAIKMYSDGIIRRIIAAKLKVPSSTIAGWIGERDQWRGYPRQYPIETIEHAIQLYNDGMSFTGIAAKLKVHRRTISSWVGK